MTRATDKALKLAGFLLAHALWVMSELREGELYVPQVLCENKDGSKELFVFEAESQLEAIEKGKKFLLDGAQKFELCAFARDGQVNPGTGYVDVLIVDVIEQALPPMLTIIQPYSPTHKGDFHLLGDELLLMDTGQLSSTQTRQITTSIRNGANEHVGANEMWRKLESARTKDSPLR